MRKVVTLVAATLAAVGFSLPAHAATPSVSFDQGMDGSIQRSAPVIPSACVPDPTQIDPSTIDPNDPVGSVRNQPQLCQEPPAQADGYISGTASSDAVVTRVEVIFTEMICTDPQDSPPTDCVAGPTGSDIVLTGHKGVDPGGQLDCTDTTFRSCAWSANLGFPMAPGQYNVQAEVTDSDGAQADATPISITVL